MNKVIRYAVLLLCVGSVAASVSGCNSGKCVVLGSPAKAEEFTYDERIDEGYISVNSKANDFAYKFSAAAHSRYDPDKNFSVAPVSVFSALSLAAECAGGQTRSELLSALGVDYPQLSNDYSKLYRSLNFERKTNTDDLAGMLSLSNSVWINEGVKYNAPCVENLSQKYFAYSYSADFANDNANANKAVRKFVKDSTKGLIDKDLQLSDDTVVTLINTLYLKDIWNSDGEDISFTGESYTFTEHNSNTKKLKLLQGYYNAGRAVDCGNFTTFFTSTFSGFKIKFILPKQEYSAGDVFTAENLKRVNSLENYNAVDDESLTRYYTRCFFPEFKTEYDEPINDVLKADFGVSNFFDRYSCDFSSFTQSDVYCEKVRHVNTLTVDKKGIEGAAVTCIQMDGTSAPGYYEAVYEDFIVDREFGFILTYGNEDSVVFSGIVNYI